MEGWAIIQYVICSALFPLVVEKGYPPRWYAASFAVYGLVLGVLVALLPGRQDGGGGGGAPRPTPAPVSRGATGEEDFDERIRRWREQRARA